MTFSILASNSKTGELCVATSTCFVAVGCRVPKIIPGVGAVAVQASPKPSNRKSILTLIKKGYSNENAVKQVLKTDKKKQERQIAVIKLNGKSYVFSGRNTVKISESFIGKNFVIAGNMLGSHSVVSAMVTAFDKNSQLFLPKRLLKALYAGEKAGGDKRGRLSAAILYSKPNIRTMTLRIDYSKNPLRDLSLALDLRYSKNYKNSFDN